MFHTWVVCVFCSTVSPESSCNSYLCNETLHDGEDGGGTLVVGAVWTLEARGAVHKHDEVPHAPERCQRRARGVDVYQLRWSLGARRRVMGS